MTDLTKLSADARLIYMAVIGVYLLVLLYIGYVAMRRVKGVSDFYIGGRTISPLVLGFTYLATFASAAAYIGAPGMVYKFGLSGTWSNLIAVWGMLFGIMLLSARTGRLGRLLNADTLPEMLSERYGTNLLGAITSIVAILALVPMMMVQYKGAGIVMSSLLGIPYVWAVVFFGVVVAVYTMAGGFLAVVWTDTFQGIVMMLATVVILSIGWAVAGGPSGLVTKLAAQSPDLISVSGAGNFWNPIYIIGLIVLLTTFQAGPQQAVRFMSTRSQRILRFGMMFTALTVFVSALSIIGAVTRANFPGLTDPDTAMAVFVVQYVPPWWGAIVYGGLLAAMMSSVDSYLHVAGTVAVHDIYQRLFRVSQVSDARLNAISRTVVGVVGLMGLIFALWPPQLLQLLLFYASGVMAISYFVPLFFGLYWRRATKHGAVACAILGPTLLVILQSGLKIPLGNAFIITVVVSSLTMVVVSLLTKAPEEAELRRVFPWSAPLAMKRAAGQ